FASSLLYAAGLATIGLSTALPLYWLGWIVLGLGMGTGLYDAVFAALGRVYGADARGPITNLTLFGRFAGTVCWPLSAFLIDHFGWREACFIYAALHVLLSLPLQMAVVRRPKVATATRAETQSSGAGDTARIEREGLVFALLALILSI